MPFSQADFISLIQNRQLDNAATYIHDAPSFALKYQALKALATDETIAEADVAAFFARYFNIHADIINESSPLTHPVAMAQPLFINILAYDTNSPRARNILKIILNTKCAVGQLAIFSVLPSHIAQQHFAELKLTEQDHLLQVACSSPIKVLDKYKLKFFIKLTRANQRKILHKSNPDGVPFYLTAQGKQFLVAAGGLCFQADDKLTDLAETKDLETIVQIREMLNIEEKATLIANAIAAIVPWQSRIQTLQAAEEQEREEEQKQAAIALAAGVDAKIAADEQEPHPAPAIAPQLSARQREIADLQTNITAHLTFVSKYWFADLSRDEQIKILRSKKLTTFARGKILLHQPIDKQRELLCNMTYLAGKVTFIRKSILRRMTGEDLGQLFVNFAPDVDVNAHNSNTLDFLSQLFDESHFAALRAAILTSLVKNRQIKLAAQLFMQFVAFDQENILRCMRSEDVAILFQEVKQNSSNLIDMYATFRYLLLALYCVAIILIVIALLYPSAPIITITLGFWLFIDATVTVLISSSLYWLGVALFIPEKNLQLLGEQSQIRRETQNAMFCSLSLELQGKYLADSYFNNTSAMHYYLVAVENAPTSVASLLNEINQQQSRYGKWRYADRIESILSYFISTKIARNQPDILNSCFNAIEANNQALMIKITYQYNTTTATLATRTIAIRSWKTFFDSLRIPQKIAVLNAATLQGELALKTRLLLHVESKNLDDDYHSIRALFHITPGQPSLHEESQLFLELATRNHELARRIIVFSFVKGIELLRHIRRDNPELFASLTAELQQHDPAFFARMPEELKPNSYRPDKQSPQESLITPLISDEKFSQAAPILTSSS